MPTGPFDGLRRPIYGHNVDNHLRGITPAGKAYVSCAKSRVQTEFAGACFSPDGSTFFVNLMWPTMTLAITGTMGAGAGTVVDDSRSRTVHV